MVQEKMVMCTMGRFRRVVKVEGAYIGLDRPQKDKMWPYSDENAKKADMEESRFNRLHGFMWGRIDDRSL
jgi:hypothetical protein